MRTLLVLALFLAAAARADDIHCSGRDCKHTAVCERHTERHTDPFYLHLKLPRQCPVCTEDDVARVAEHLRRHLARKASDVEAKEWADRTVVQEGWALAHWWKVLYSLAFLVMIPVVLFSAVVYVRVYMRWKDDGLGGDLLALFLALWVLFVLSLPLHAFP